MRRCFELARLGAGSVSPNPMVGAVLVHGDRIIGEGWHRRYGEAHAEVHALASVREADRHLIGSSTLYVSLEPCNVFGKTPPCTDLILRHRIPRVVVSCQDLSPAVSGRGIRQLQEAGVEVRIGILAQEGRALCRIRETFVRAGRPFILLKYARSADGYLGREGEQVAISHPYTQRWVHRLRSRYDAILVGTRTVLTDDPALTDRYWGGRHPLRIVLDRRLEIPSTAKVLQDGHPTLLVTERPSPPASPAGVRYLSMPFGDQFLHRLAEALHRLPITSLLVEGGGRTLQAFADQGLWDQALVIDGAVTTGPGIPAPRLSGHLTDLRQLGTDRLLLFDNPAADR